MNYLVFQRHGEGIELRNMRMQVQFKRCDGARDEAVVLARHGDEIVAEWTDTGIPDMLLSMQTIR